MWIKIPLFIQNIFYQYWHYRKESSPKCRQGLKHNYNAIPHAFRPAPGSNFDWAGSLLSIHAHPEVRFRPARACFHGACASVPLSLFPDELKWTFPVRFADILLSFSSPRVDSIREYNGSGGSEPVTGSEMLLRSLWLHMADLHPWFLLPSLFCLCLLYYTLMTASIFLIDTAEDRVYKCLGCVYGRTSIFLYHGRKHRLCGGQ